MTAGIGPTFLNMVGLDAEEQQQGDNDFAKRYFARTTINK
jgi:hypothetical protein